MNTPTLLIPPADKIRLRVMFLAKHAKASGTADAADGNHAIYHHEMRTTLEGIGLNVIAQDSFDAIYSKPDVDYVVTLLNRGGFVNSEMLAPLLLTRHGIPFMGASPIVRGLGDDKHLMKMAALHRGVPVTPWEIHRQGQGALREPAFEWKKLVVKPNASSASWGVGIFEDWAEAEAHAQAVLAEGHDAIVEAYAPQTDVVVPVVSGANGPWILPMMRFQVEGRDDNFRSYEEKRSLGDDAAKEELMRVEDPALEARLQNYVRAMLKEVWPCDYGRFEFRYDPATRDVRFMEVNLSCNLWSKKTVSGAARSIGVGHAALVETIVAHSMLRQGVIDHALGGERGDVPVRLEPALPAQVEVG
ncbi:MAG: phosphoribosylglycinamide synthetase [Pseudomonadota bacterium]|nr:phosphoribosylglycinamide synthetase [Pseudomonadota bacterium]